MSWIVTIVVALLSGALGLAVAGYVAAAWANWYHVSNFEGASGYLVVGIGLLGGVAGIVIGVLVSRYLGGPGSAGFLKAGLISLACIASIGGIAAVIGRMGADIAPEQDGQTLTLEVELRFPAGERPDADADWRFELASVEGGRQRAKQEGGVRMDAVREEAGRWIMPAGVYLFTQRGQRVIRLAKGLEGYAAFGMPTTSGPVRAGDAWSEWLPPRQQDGSAWPDSKMSYRYRYQLNAPPKPAPDPRIAEADAFVALRPDDPVEQWIAHMPYSAPFKRVQAVMKVVEARQPEVAQLIRAPDGKLRAAGLRVVVSLEQVQPEIRDAVAAEGEALADALRAFNAMDANDTGFMDTQVALRSRFNEWKTAWWVVIHRFEIDGRTPLQTMRDLAEKRAADTTMGEIVTNAQVLLDEMDKRNKPAN
ncbi:MAG: YrzE family protein [Chromatiales bacterium]|nr:YrzE family protein [Chromatiales bacterium]